VHELSIAENMLQVTLRYAGDHIARQVTDLYVKVGDLASVEALEFHWKTVSQGTLAEGSELHFELIPTRLHCEDCGQTNDYHPEHDVIHSHDYHCPSCSSGNVQIVSGGDMFRLDSIEVDV
jgi:hydrogenase nickel incorporation protein HypA/HybF